MEKSVRSNKEIRRIVYKTLPQKPYKIGIHKDLFEKLKHRLPGQRTKLRKAIKFILMKKTTERNYLLSVMKSRYRYGIDHKRFPVTIANRRYSKELLDRQFRKNR